MDINPRTRGNEFDLLIERLSQTCLVRYLTVIYLESCFAYDSVRRYLEQGQELLTSEHRLGKKCNIHKRGECPPELMSALQSQLSQSIMYFFRLYHRFSGIYILLIALRKSLPLERLIISVMQPTLPANCYLLGRQTIFTDLYESGMIAIFASLHLTWRLMRFRHRQPLRLDLFGFLMFTNEQVGSEYLNVESQIDERRSPNWSCKDLLARQLRSIIRLPLESGQTNLWTQTIRPNRTPEAHKKLCRNLISVSLVVFATVTPMIILGGVRIIWCLINDHKYIERYPGCNPTLERAIVGSGESSWLQNPNWHRLFSIPFDFTDSFFFWAENLINSMVEFPMFYIINEDLLIYCKNNLVYLNQLNEKLAIVNRISSQLEFKIGGQVSSRQVDSDEDRSVCHELRVRESILLMDNSVQFHLEKFTRRSTDITELHELSETSGIRENSNVDELVSKSHHLLRDFFNQLDVADKYVGDYITIFASVWFAIHTGITYFSLISGNGVDPIVFALQIMLFATFTVISVLLLRLHKEAVRSYSVIYSILANIRTQNKRKFRRILEFFVGRKRATYTIFHQQPFLASSYMTLIGWTFSITFLVENLLSARRKLSCSCETHN